jgi:hypothetical protein
MMRQVRTRFHIVGGSKSAVESDADEAPRRDEEWRLAPNRPGESPEQGSMRRHPSQHSRST